jgi:ketosteroid isomerase-like protein
MTGEVHPNIALIMQLDTGDLAAKPDLFADGFVWRYFNPKLPELQGEYAGLEGLKAFFEKLATRSRGTFSIEPVSITPFGEELVVTHTRNTLAMDHETITIDAVVVWRIVDGRLAEAFDIPSAYTLAKPQ